MVQYMLNLDKYHASKRIPLQARSKETVRQILLTSARLCAAEGAASLTTNDIADAANVPIGSVYSYFEDKNAIIASLLELYHSDVIQIIDDLSDNPLLPNMNRFEIATIIIHAWVYYLEVNHPLSYVLYARSEPSLAAAVKMQQVRLQASFCRLIHTWNADKINDATHGYACQLILQQGLAIIETAELHFSGNAAAKQAYLEAAIPAYCKFIESFE